MEVRNYEDWNKFVTLALKICLTFFVNFDILVPLNEEVLISLMCQKYIVAWAEVSTLIKILFHNCQIICLSLCETRQNAFKLKPWNHTRWEFQSQLGEKLQCYRVSHNKLDKVICLWQIEICKLELVWMLPWKAEIVVFMKMSLTETVAEIWLFVSKTYCSKLQK